MARTADARQSVGQRMVHARLEPDLQEKSEDISIQDWMVQLVEKAVSDQWARVAKAEK